MVETPEDAIKCFLGTGIDYLVLDDLVMAKRQSHRLLFPIFKAGSEIASLVRAAYSAELQE